MLRLDAKKLLLRYRKPTPRIVNNVGVWHDIMVGLARIAVITNAFLIAVTSDFIPQLVYTSYYSQTGNTGIVFTSISFVASSRLVLSNIISFEVH